MNATKRNRFLCCATGAIAAALLLSSCPQAAASLSTTAETTIDFTETASCAVDFSAAETIRLTASGLKNKTLVLAKLNTGSTYASAANTGSVTLDSPAASGSSRSLRSALPRLPPPRRPHPLAGQKTNAAAGTASTRSLIASARSASVSYGDTTAEGTLEEGTTRSFWVDYYDANGNLSGFDTIAATLRKVTDHAYLWVAASGSTEASEATGGFDPSTSLTADRITLLADAFESVVFPEVTALFGYEHGGGPGGDGGVDADQHVSILVYDIDFDYSASASNGYTAGYFWSKDDETASSEDTYAASGIYPSNGREIFYLDAWALENYPYTIVSTLAHEYQHMINYNQETYEGRTPASTWLDEFRSLASEDLLAPAFADFSQAAAESGSYSDIDAYSFTGDGPGFWSRYYAYYSNSTPYFGLNVWSRQLYDYAFASMTASYLLRAYGGAAFMKDAVAQADAGLSAGTAFIAAVEAAAGRSGLTDGTDIDAGALSSFSTSDFYAEILAPFAAALWGLGADGNASASPYARSDAQAASATASSLRRLSAFTVLDETDDYTVFPGCFTFSSSVPIPACSFSFYSDTALFGMATDTATLTFEKPANGNIKYLLIAIP